MLSVFCFVCDIFMCEECLNVYNVIMWSNVYCIVNLGKFKMRDFEDLFWWFMLCVYKFKEKGVVEYFCYDCNVCVCYVCNIVI